MELHALTITEANKGLREKKFSAEELTKDCLFRINKNDTNINAFISVLEDEAIARAKEADKKGDFKNPLCGIPIAVKDNMVLSGSKTTCASKILENYVAPYDATVIAKLKEAGAVFIGKTNMDEFACGSSSETSYFGPVKNPHDNERVPGGSSGGSAAAVAADECVAALGSDTGGSIRQPASLCGTVGLKPTYGRVSRYGLFAMASSLDQIGPITKNVEDAALVLKAISGVDPKDSTTSDRRVDDYPSFLEGDVSGLRIGVPKEYFSTDSEIEGLEDGVRERVGRVIDILKERGAEIDDTISMPHTKYGLATYYIIMPSELSSNLERYDGVKYGFSDRSGKTLLDHYMDTRGTGFGPEVRRRIMLGTYSLSAGYYDAYYKRALQVRTLVLHDFQEAYKRVHCILSPTSPSVAFKIGAKSDDPLSMYLSDVYTVSANIAGVPAISIPAGVAKPKDGDIQLPVGVQILGKHFDEKLIFRVARCIEKNIGSET